MKKTEQIKRGLDEFDAMQCLKALELNENLGEGSNTIAYNLIPVTKLNEMSEAQITYAGSRMIETGRYLRFIENNSTS